MQNTEGFTVTQHN